MKRIETAKTNSSKYTASRRKISFYNSLARTYIIDLVEEDF